PDPVCRCGQTRPVVGENRRLRSQWALVLGGGLHCPAAPRRYPPSTRDLAEGRVRMCAAPLTQHSQTALLCPPASAPADAPRTRCPAAAGCCPPNTAHPPHHGERRCDVPRPTAR